MEAATLFNTFFSLIFVLGLVGLTAVGLRYLGSGRFIKKSLKKGSKKRLQLSDVLVLDAKRKLVLVKRDNVEHLILIGGEKELVVESDIRTSRGSQSDAKK